MNDWFNIFHPKGRLLSAFLIIVIGWFLYHAFLKPPDWEREGLKPGTEEYKHYHDGRLDTVPDSLKHFDTP